MHLTAGQIIDTWERANAVTQADRTHLLLSLVLTDMPGDQIDDLSIGDRNHVLLSLRNALFGPILNAFVECPACSEALEMPISLQDLRFDELTPLPASHRISSQSLSATVRLPNGHDLAELADVDTVAEGRSLLFSRCVSDLCLQGRPVEISELDETSLEILESLIEALDPRMELLFDLCCPACNYRWQSLLDAATYLWREFDTHARELLENIHLLATAYGWSESDILAMSDTRRRYYVERLLQ